MLVVEKPVRFRCHNYVVVSQVIWSGLRFPSDVDTAGSVLDHATASHTRRVATVRPCRIPGAQVVTFYKLTDTPVFV